MATSIVSYTYPHERKAEREFDSLKAAVTFADGVIEDRGSADVSTEEVFDAKAFDYSLCDIHQAN